jgi:hypothetical protein
LSVFAKDKILIKTIIFHQRSLIFSALWLFWP